MLHSDSAACYEAQQLLSRQLIEQSLEEMVTELNSKRSRDQTLLESVSCDILILYFHVFNLRALLGRFQEGPS